MATERADQFLRQLDIDPHAGDALARLRAVEVPRLLAAQSALAQANARFAQTMPMFMPVVPSAMTQEEMLDAIADGADGKDMLIGATADEVHAFYAADPTMQNPPPDALVERFGGEAALVRYSARRPGASAMDLLADLGTDETFLLPSVRLADAIAARGGNAYAYLFDWAPPGARFKACHCIDLPFVFGNFDAWHDAAMLEGGDTTQMAALSDAMRAAWIAFVHTGDPAHDRLLTWPRHDAERRQTMRFGARIGALGDPACIGA
jgi:para-nitrobenzyl esterase